MGLKINFIAQLSPLVHGGGGEQILRRLLEIGEQRGHRFGFATAAPSQNNLFPDPDLSILADVFNTPYALRKLPAALVAKTVTDGRFIHFDNAYVDVCNRDYLPCSGTAQEQCPSQLTLHQRVLSRDFSGRCFRQRPLIGAMYRRSLFNVFLSPLHHRVISGMLGLADREAFILKPLIDEGLFYDRGGERDLDYLFVGVISEAKGLAEMRRRFADRNIHLIGKIARGETLDFGHYLGTVPYREVPLYMNRAKNFVFLPRWPEPQGRVVVEAAMCGCQLIANDRVGALSFDFPLSRPELFRAADQEFWLEVERRA